MATLRRNLFIFGWCVIGSLLIDLPSATVLNNASSGTDFFIPLIGAWDLHCGALHHSALGAGFYLPYEFIGWLFGYGDWTVRYTQAMIFILISCLAWFTLNNRLGGWLAASATAYLSLYAASPVNVGDSPFVIYQSIYYDLLPIALGQLAILCAFFPAPRRGIGLVVICCLLGLESMIKTNLAMTDTVLVAAAFVVLRRDFFAVLPVMAVGGLTAIMQFNPDLARASHVRLHNLLAEPVGYLDGSLTYGVAGGFSKIANYTQDTFWIWSIPTVAIVVTLSKIGRPAMSFAVVLAGLVGADLLRSVTNSVDMTWPFTILVTLAYLRNSK